ncbi:MAG TPA: ATP-binding protein [Pyrinomonadaceae bacterium]|jgi:predicted kinase
MEAVIFVGIQGSGKSTFFKQRFVDTHIRLNLDMLRTRFRENLLFEACLEAKQKFVVDNTNLTRAERERYLVRAKIYGFKTVGFYFKTDLQRALARNDLREGKAKIPEKAILAACKRLQLPVFDEGFDELFYVSNDNGGFTVDIWKNEI